MSNIAIELKAISYIATMNSGKDFRDSKAGNKLTKLGARSAADAYLFKKANDFRQLT